MHAYFNSSHSYWWLLAGTYTERCQIDINWLSMWYISFIHSCLKIFLVCYKVLLQTSHGYSAIYMCGPFHSFMHIGCMLDIPVLDAPWLSKHSSTILFFSHKQVLAGSSRFTGTYNSFGSTLFYNFTALWFQLSKQNTTCRMPSWLICSRWEYQMPALSKRSFLPSEITTNIPSLC